MSADLVPHPNTGELVDISALSPSQRVTVDGDEYEFSAPSSDAGTTRYREDVLRCKLCALVGDGTITESAASAALVRTVNVLFAVPWDAELADLRAALEGEEVRVQIAGAEVTVINTNASERPTTRGINALRKVPGAGKAIDGATVKQEPPARKVKITVKRRGT
jgi:hypothetical protein